MKMKKFLAVFLAAAVLLSCLSACSGSSDTSSGDNNSSQSTIGSSSEESEANDSSSEGSAVSIPASDVVNGEENQQSYPLTTDDVTLSFWYPWGGSMAELADFNDSYFFQWYEELTGVHIDFIVPASGSEVDAFQLLFASDDMPDMLYTDAGSYTYRNGQDAAIEDDTLST